MTWLLVDVGCAECRMREPLVNVIGLYNSVAEAKEAAVPSHWRDRDDGGAYSVDTDGGYEILPVPGTS